MMAFTSYSQAAQDAFAWESNGRRCKGTFLDIGSNDPIFHNNTYMLELLGWTGMCVDIQPFNYSERKCEFVQADATKLNPKVYKFLMDHKGQIDYLSMDADDATREALKVIPWNQCSFNCITVEHDRYRIGPELQNWIYEFLTDKGYIRTFHDIKAPIDHGMPWSQQPFEDWYVKA